MGKERCNGKGRGGTGWVGRNGKDEKGKIG